ncbi:MAG: hypothetical protein IIA72_02885 [Proteobacteria bacterium]|nr:hypothetical protein [Pseudomonadota bacterium]
MPKKQHILSIGNKVDLNGRKYLVEHFIKHGGSGEVYQISRDQQKYALKLFFPYYQTMFKEDDKNMLQEIFDLQVREYTFLSSMNHPNIVRVIDSGIYSLRKVESKRLPIKSIERLPFIVEDFVDGPPLMQALSEFNINDNQAAQILLGICEVVLHRWTVWQAS